MQIIVRSLAPNTDVPILSTYDDDVVVDMTTQPQGAFSVRGIPSKYVQGRTLTQDWYNDYSTVVNAEAAIRIDVAFPASMQSSAALLRQNLFITDGMDPSTWPPDDQAKNAEIQRGTDYITAVNAAATAIIASAPSNPCDDSLWPTPITPINLS
jgi:hypothetical protein